MKSGQIRLLYSCVTALLGLGLGAPPAYAKKTASALELFTSCQLSNESDNKVLPGYEGLGNIKSISVSSLNGAGMLEDLAEGKHESAALLMSYEGASGGIVLPAKGNAKETQITINGKTFPATVSTYNGNISINDEDDDGKQTKVTYALEAKSQLVSDGDHDYDYNVTMTLTEKKAGAQPLSYSFECSGYPFLNGGTPK